MFNWFRRNKVNDATIEDRFHIEDMYKLKDGVELSSSDTLELIMYLNTYTIIPYGIIVPPGFSAISCRQYDNLPDKFKDYFYKIEMTFKKTKDL